MNAKPTVGDILDRAARNMLADLIAIGYEQRDSSLDRTVDFDDALRILGERFQMEHHRPLAGSLLTTLRNSEAEFNREFATR